MDIGIIRASKIIFFILVSFGYSACKIQQNSTTRFILDRASPGYKINFLEDCVHQFDPDTSWRQFEYFIELDMQGLREQDTLRSIVRNEIKKEMLPILEDHGGDWLDFSPASDCIYDCCLDMYESSAMQSLANNFARREKKRISRENQNWLTKKVIMKKIRNQK
ncbi:MAG: hypothetical protein ABJB16_13925 [Saprospiraceae bacterium]